MTIRVPAGLTGGNERASSTVRVKGTTLHNIRFLSLAEMAEAAGFSAAEADLFFFELVNDPGSLIQPYVMTPEGIPMAVGRQALADRYFYTQSDVRVRDDEVDVYVEARARVMAAKPADDFNGYPTDFVGRPDLKRFTKGEHIARWLASGGSLTSEDVDSEINAHLMRIIESEDPNNEPEPQL